MLLGRFAVRERLGKTTTRVRTVVRGLGSVLVTDSIVVTVRATVFKFTLSGSMSDLLNFVDQESADTTKYAIHRDGAASVHCVNSVLMVALKS